MTKTLLTKVVTVSQFSLFLSGVVLGILAVDRAILFLGF